MGDLFSPLVTPDEVKRKNLKQIGIPGAKTKQEDEDSDNLSVETVKRNGMTPVNKMESQMYKKLSKLEVKFKEKMNLATNAQNINFGTLTSINRKDSLEGSDGSFVDSEGSHHKTETIGARNFEIYDKKRLIFDIKEKESTISNLVEAIQFCHEKHSSSGINKSLVNFS